MAEARAERLVRENEVERREVILLDFQGLMVFLRSIPESFQRTANLATRVGVETDAVRVHAPLLELTKGDIVRAGTALGVDYGLTTSCYDPDADGAPCTTCDACQLRARGFEEAGLEDPLRRRCS